MIILIITLALGILSVLLDVLGKNSRSKLGKPLLRGAAVLFAFLFLIGMIFSMGANL